MIRLRALEPGDDVAVARVFDATVGLGQALPFRLAAAGSYRRLCLGWYLSEGRSEAAVVEHDGEVQGYVLVCTDTTAHSRWVRRQVPRYALAVVLACLVPRRGGWRSWRFHLDRLADARHLTIRTVEPMPVHAHLNLAPTLRSGTAALAAVDHVDRRCAAAGAPGWYGEVNARVGRRIASLVRLGLVVTAVTPNRTLSRVVGEPVVRLTVVRSLAADQPVPSRATAAAQR